MSSCSWTYAQDARRERLHRSEHGPAGRGNRVFKRDHLPALLNKEDLVTALALQTMERRTLLFAKAATFKGRPRERFMAIGVADELFGRLHPQYYRSEMIIKLADLEERASAERLATLQQLECSCLADVSAIVESAVAQGDLTLPPSMKPAEIVYAVFTLAIGTQTTLHIFRTILENLAIEDPLASSRNNMQALLDGLGWRPLRASGALARLSHESLGRFSLMSGSSQVSLDQAFFLAHS